MPVSLPLVGAARHHRLPEKAGSPARAHLRKAENWQQQAEIIREVFRLTFLSLKEFAGKLGVEDERQVSRWMADEPTERPQSEVVIRAFYTTWMVAMGRVAPELERESIVMEESIRIVKRA